MGVATIGSRQGKFFFFNANTFIRNVVVTALLIVLEVSFQFYWDVLFVFVFFSTFIERESCYF